MIIMRNIFIATIILIIMLFICLLVNHGKFIIDSNSTFIGVVYNDSYYYFGNLVSWTGIVRPKINSIQLLKSNGKTLNKDDHNDFLILLDESYNVGLLYEDDIEVDGIQFRDPVGYKLKEKTLNIVIKTHLNIKSVNEVDRLLIQYSILGFKREETINISLIDHNI